DVIVQALAAPYEERSDYLLESFFRQGRLYFTPEELEPILTLSQQKPTINVVYLDRAAILTEIAEVSEALVVHYDSIPEVIAELLFGEFEPEGKLPFELPRSQAAVAAQAEDAPYDSENPLFPFGHGLSYTQKIDTLSTNSIN
ncbi:MAG: glycoside hydrolase family 3 C-terminal domain-containing protein, partial [Bacteroidota bacterium]